MLLIVLVMIHTAAGCVRWSQGRRLEWESDSGRTLTLEDVPVNELSKVEVEALQRVAVAKLQEMDIPVSFGVIKGVCWVFVLCRYCAPYSVSVYCCGYCTSCVALLVGNAYFCLVGSRNKNQRLSFNSFKQKKVPSEKPKKLQPAAGECVCVRTVIRISYYAH